MNTNDTLSQEQREALTVFNALWEEWQAIPSYIERYEREQENEQCQS